MNGKPRTEHRVSEQDCITVIYGTNHFTIALRQARVGLHLMASTRPARGGADERCRA